MDFISTLKKLLGNTYNQVVNAPFDRIGAQARQITAQLPKNESVLQRSAIAAPQIARSISNNLLRDVPIANVLMPYVGNKIATPAIDVPAGAIRTKTALDKKQYGEAAKEALFTGLNAVYTGANLVNPIGTQAANLPFTGFDSVKNMIRAGRESKNIKDAAVKGFTGEEVIGLGDAVTKNRKIADILNTGELIGGLAIPAIHGIMTRKTPAKTTQKVASEVYTKMNDIVDKNGFGLSVKEVPGASKKVPQSESIMQEALPFTTEQVPANVNPENMGVSKFSQTVVKKGKTTPGVKEILKNEPQMYEKRNLGQVSENVANTVVTEDHVKRFTADDFKPTDFGDSQKNFEDATASIQYLNSQGRDNEAAIIFNKMSLAGTAKGQWNAMLKVLLNQTPQGKIASVKKVIEDYVANHTGGMDKLLKTKLSKFEWTPEFEKELKDLAVAVEKTKGTPEADIAMKAFLDKAFGAIPPGVNDYVTSLRINGLLSAPTGFAKNALSNLIMAGIARPLDILTTPLMRGSLEGIPQTIKYYSAMVSALKEAGQVAKKSFREGNTWQQIEFQDINKGTLKEYMNAKIQKNTRNITNLWGVPTRALEATDRFFQTLIKSGEKINGSTEAQAQAIADKYLFRQMFDPNNLTKQGYVSMSIDKLGEAISKFRNVPILGWTVPFVKTIVNVSKELLERSPVGFLNMAGNSNKGLALAKATTGTAIMLTAFSFLDRGEYATDAPRDPQEASDWYASGRKAWSIKMGNNFVPIEYFGAFSFPLALAMIAKDKASVDPESATSSVSEKMMGGIKDSVSYWLKTTPQKSLNDLFEAISDPNGNGFEQFITNYPKQVVPASGLIRWVTQAVDPTYRKAQKGNFMEQFMKDTPGVSTMLKPYTDPVGNPSMRNQAQTLLGAPYQIGSFNEEFDKKVKENERKARLNAEVRKNEQIQQQLMDSPEGQKIAEMNTIQGIYAKKQLEEEKNKIIKSVMNLPQSYQVQAFKNYNITQDDVKNFELKTIKSLDTSATADYIMKQPNNNFTKLYEQGVLTNSVAKMLEKKGYINDYQTLMDNMKKTDVFEQKQVMRKTTKSYIKKLASLQKRTVKSMLTKKPKTFKLPKTKAYKPKKFKAYKAPKMKFPKIKTRRK